MASPIFSNSCCLLSFFFCIVFAEVFNADACHKLAGSLGKIWRKHRRSLPADIKGAFAELLLACRLHILPKDIGDATSQISHARYDIRCLSDLFVRLAMWYGPCNPIPLGTWEPAEFVAEDFCFSLEPSDIEDNTPIKLCLNELITSASCFVSLPQHT